VFKNDIQNFPVYLFAGRMMFSFITDCVGVMLHSIVINGQLMRKTRIPYYVFPLSAMGCSVVNFLFQLVAFLIVLAFTGTWPSIHTVAFPLVCLEMFGFSFGFGMLLAVAEIYMRDTNYLFAVMTTAWMYLTPLFYPITLLPELMQKLISWLNPAYYYVHMSRSIFLDHAWPDPSMLLRGGAAAVLFTALGLFVYSKAKKQMILYV
jgi:lipopolysaccharide transport system permease protein